MNRQRLETGIERLHYVAWGCSILFGIAIASEAYPYEDAYDVVYALKNFLIFSIVPGVIKWSGRWIYRGFFPAAGSSSNTDGST